MIQLDGKEHRIGLALSGGGFRASIFHMGVMRRLQELGILNKIDVISTVSGGSIVGAYYVLKKPNWGDILGVEEGFKKGLQANIRLRGLTGAVIFRPIGFAKSLLPGPTRTNVVAGEFDKHFFHGATLDQLPETPKLVINATSLNTGAVWRFSKERMGDWKFGYGPAGEFPVKDAVGASAAVPGLFAPLVLARKDLGKMEVSPEFGHHRRVNLSDGGVRDNQGLTNLFFEDICDYIICSDASGLIEADPKPSKLAVQVLLRSNNITMDAARDWIVQMLYLRKQSGKIRQMAFFDLKDEVQKGAPGLPHELVNTVANIRTDLDYFDKNEIFVLKYHGYTLADDRIRRYAEELIQTEDVEMKWREEFPPETITALKHVLRKAHKRRLRPHRF
ncbi:MAG: patatin-like phospholipase family protein [Candidatus Scalinduaceae bacterium]